MNLIYGAAVLVLSMTFQMSQAFGGLPVFDPEFQCISEQKANQYINDFGIKISGFGGLELCNAQIDSKKLFNDLSIIEDGRFLTQGPHHLIGNFVDSNRYYSWLKSQTEGMSRGNDVPWATAYNSMGYFTMQDGWAQLSTLGRVGVVIHEARHTEGYRHIPCNFGPYAGSSLPGCDTSFNYGGSHGVEMEYYARVVVYGENFHPLYKKMARLMALGRSNFVFNEKVLAPREGLFLIQQDNSAGLLIDGNNSYPREISGTGTLKRTSFGPTLFTPDRAFALETYEVLGDTRPTEDGYSYFKLLSLKNNRPNGQAPMELEEYDLGNKRYLAALDSRGQWGLYNFGGGKWGAFQALSGTPTAFKTQFKDKKGLFILMNNGKLAQIMPDKNKVAETEFNWDPNVTNYFKGPQGENLQLNKDGVIRTIEGTVWSLTQTNTWSQGVNIPLYDAFEVR